MSKPNLVHKMCKDSFLISKDRTLKHLQEFRNMRISLLDTIWVLLKNTQQENRALTSLIQCKDLLEDCLKSLQNSESDLSNIYNMLVSRKMDNKSLDEYINKLGCAIRKFVEDQDALYGKGHKDSTKETLQDIIVENIGILQLAIQMLELLTETDKNLVLKLKKREEEVKIPRDNIAKPDDKSERKSDIIVTYRRSQSRKNNRLKGGVGRRTLIKWSSREQNLNQSLATSKIFLGGIRKSRSEISRHAHFGNGRFGLSHFRYNYFPHGHFGRGYLSQSHFGHFRHVRDKAKLLKLDRDMTPRTSIYQNTTMKDTAGYIIDTFLNQKSSLRTSSKCSAYLSGLKIIDVGLGDAWLELCEMYQQKMKYPTYLKLEDLKEALTTFYLTKMQILLQRRPTKPTFYVFKKNSGKATPSSSRRPTLRMTSSMRLLLSQNSPESKVIAMHKLFYSTQLEKLRESQKVFNTRKLYSLIMNQDVPESKSEITIFKQYETDPEHYNVLMMILNRDIHRENLLQIINRNVEEIKSTIDRKKRQLSMSKSLDSRPSSRYRFRHTDMDRISQRSDKSDKSFVLKDARIVFDEEFFKLNHAKWTKYFAKQEKTPLEKTLDSMRRQREKKLQEQMIMERNQERQPRRHLRPIISLYEAPRLTNRVRQAMENIKDVKSVEKVHEKKDIKLKRKDIKKQRHILADALFECESWTSSCSECRSLQEETPALDRFHRTQEQILASTNYCDYNPSNR